MPIIAAYMVPHPPMIVPQIGRGSEKEVRQTIEAYEAVAAEIAEIRPETMQRETSEAFGHRMSASGNVMTRNW